MHNLINFCQPFTGGVDGGVGPGSHEAGDVEEGEKTDEFVGE